MFLFQFNTWGLMIGLMVGVLLSFRFGLLGLMFGIYLGNKLDEAIAKQHRSAHKSRKRQFWNNQTITLAYQLFGHLAKIDGHITQHSITVIENSMKTFHLSKKARSLAKQAFQNGKDPSFSYHSTIQQLQIMLMLNPNIKNHIANIAVQLVEQDPNASTKKRHRLTEILRSLGIIHFNTGWQGQHYQRFNHGQTSHQHTQGLSWAYAILGVSATTSWTDIKRKYRKMLSDNHPDRLHAKGKPSAMDIKKANDKTIDIKKAYELIKERFDTQTA